MDVTFKVFVTGGYNQAIIDLAVSLAEQHILEPSAVEHITLEQNYLETVRPSPSFPSPSSSEGRYGSTPHCLATALITRSFPLYGLGRTIGVADAGEREDPRIAELMKKIEVRPSKRRTYFAPKIDIKLAGGRHVRGEYSGRELMWDFASQRSRIEQCVPLMPVPPSQFRTLVDCVAAVERLRSVDRLVQLTLAPNEKDHQAEVAVGAIGG
jgi:hypothetical protein